MWDLVTFRCDPPSHLPLQPNAGFGVWPTQWYWPATCRDALSLMTLLP